MFILNLICLVNSVNLCYFKYLNILPNEKYIKDLSKWWIYYYRAMNL